MLCCCQSTPSEVRFRFRSNCSMIFVEGAGGKVKFALAVCSQISRRFQPAPSLFRADPFGGVMFEGDIYLDPFLCLTSLFFFLLVLSVFLWFFRVSETRAQTPICLTRRVLLPDARTNPVKGFWELLMQFNPPIFMGSPLNSYYLPQN